MVAPGDGCPLKTSSVTCGEDFMIVSILNWFELDCRDINNNPF